MGGGHDGVGKVMRNHLLELGVDCEMKDFLDAAPRMGKFLERAFRLEVKRAPWAYKLEYWLWNRFPLMTHIMRRLFRLLFQRGMAGWIGDFRPDMIISVHPFPAQLLGQMRKRGNRTLGSTPLATFLTDFSVHPLWVHPSVDLHLCVSKTAEEHARSQCGPKAPITTVGPFVDEKFFFPANQAIARERLGLPIGRTIVLIVSGSWGVGDVESTFRALAKEPDLLPVLLCGQNQQLKQRLASVKGGVAVGWTTDVDLYMAASDIVVQNAGGLSALEAMASGRPVLTYKPIAGHGVENSHAMVAAGVTQLVESEEELARAVRDTLANPEPLMAAAASQFTPHPEQAILELLHAARPKRRFVTDNPAMRGTKVLLRLGSAFVAANLVSGLIGYRGLNLAKASADSHYIYLALLAPGPASASNLLDNLLLQNNIALVTTGNIASSDPAALLHAYQNGVEIVNGGTGHSSDFNFLLPNNDLSGGRSTIDSILGTKVNIYIPQNTINAVDLAWAGIHHQTVAPAHIVSVARLPELVVRPGAIIEIRSSLRAQENIIAIRAELNRLAARGFTVAPLSTLSNGGVPA